jgi:hypothetical protein
MERKTPSRAENSAPVAGRSNLSRATVAPDPVAALPAISDAWGAELRAAKASQPSSPWQEERPRRGN